MARIPEPMTQEQLTRRLSYDKFTGRFTWKRNDMKPDNWNVRYVGTEAGHKTKTAIQITLDYKPYLAHRLAFLYVVGYFPYEIDHIDGNPYNNAWSNLREVTHAENMQNQKLYSTSKTGIAGITWHQAATAWQARIQVNGYRIDLGRHKDFFEAICARKRAELRYGFIQHGKNS